MVQIDGVSVGVITPDSLTYTGYTTDSFAVSAGAHTLTLAGMTPDGAGDCSTFIDRVSIAKVESLVSVTLTADHGTLALGSTEGLTLSNGTGNGDATMTFTGTLSDVNAALDGLRYTPENDFVGTANLQIITDDLAPQIAGGPQIVTNNVAINVSVLQSATESSVSQIASGEQQAATSGSRSVASDANGNYVVIWSSQNQDGSWDVYAQRFSADGFAPGRPVPGQYPNGTRPEGRQSRHARRRHVSPSPGPRATAARPARPTSISEATTPTATPCRINRSW